MYEVYSQTRPGRPRWAVAACAFLLLLTLALAAMLSANKTRGNRVSLTSESEFFPAGRLRVRMPADWNREKGKLSAVPGVVAEARRFSVDSRPPPIPRARRSSFSEPRPAGTVFLPSMRLRASAKYWAGPMSMTKTSPSPPEWAPCRPGRWSTPRTRAAAVPCSTASAEPRLHPTARSPGLSSPAPALRTKRIAACWKTWATASSCRTCRPRTNRRKLMKAAGITFTPPADARFFATTSDKPLPLPRVRLVGGEGANHLVPRSRPRAAGGFAKSGRTRGNARPDIAGKGGTALSARDSHRRQSSHGSTRPRADGERQADHAPVECRDRRTDGPA